MIIRSFFSCICLLIHCYIYYNEAASDDEQDFSRKRSRKWTNDEEKNLIYFDVLTDTGEPKHFDRIKNMWSQEYPESNVTDTALRTKIRKLRKESQEEGELKKNFKWDEVLDRELLNVYQNTSPYDRIANVTLEEEWKRRHPDYKSSRRYLLIRIWKFLRENKYPESQSQGSSGAASLGDNERSDKWIRHKWTKEWNDRLRNLEKLTDTGEPYQFERLKSMWFEKYPHSDVTNSALLTKFQRLRRETKRKGAGSRKNLRWNQESEKELLDIYFSTYPYKNNVNTTLEDEWNRRYQGHRITRKYLKDRAHKLINENKYPEYGAQESFSVDLPWDNKHDPEIIHSYNIALPAGGSYLKKAHRIWSELHPEYSHVTLEQFKERVDKLKRNPPNENFPWTEEENRELLKIYDETMPDKEDQGQRLYDIWSQRHPRYKFMTPYYLLIHASTLTRKHELKVVSKYARSGWTDLEKADLVDLVHRYPRAQHDQLHAFHMEWVRRHPRLAYKTNPDLLFSAKKFEREGIKPSLRETDEGSPSGVLELKHQTRNKYTPRMKKELSDLYYQTFPKEIKHSSRMKKEWYKKYKDLTPIKSQSLKQLVRKWGGRGPNKRADKAPMVYSSDESGPSSPPLMSEDSE